MRLPLALLGLAAATALGGLAAGQASYNVVPGAYSADDITPDGRWIVGRGQNPSNLQNEGYVWDWRNDPQPSFILGDCRPFAISDDGTVIAGQFDVRGGFGTAGRWTQATGWVPIGELGGPCDINTATVFDMTGDGETIVGLGWIGCEAYAFRWTPGAGMLAGQTLSLSTNPGDRANAIARDAGTVLAGFAQSTNRTPAFWNPDLTGLVLDPLNFGEFDGVSPDGSKLYGYITDVDNAPTAPGRAIEYDVLSGTWQVLGAGSANPAPWAGRARGVNRPCNFADRTVYGSDFIGLGADAWIWRDDGQGIRRLNDVLHEAGVLGLPGLNWIQGISDDGSTLVGHNNFGDAWVVEIPTGIATVASGCGTNPAGSIGVLCGTPRVGTTMVVGLHDPIGTMAPGALSRLGVYSGPFPGACGLNVPYGMSAPGAPAEFLVLPPKYGPSLAGANWDGANPAAVPIPIPFAPGLVGATVAVQGALVDTSGGPHVGLTDALILTFSG